MQAFPTDTHGLIHRTTLIDIGFTDDDIRRAIRAKRVARIARGVFVYAGERTAEEWHRLKALASRIGQAAKVPLTHQSAATVLGLAMLKPNLRRVHTWSRAQMIEAGLPMPSLQCEFVDEDGNVVARTDFDWHGLVARGLTRQMEPSW